MTDQRVEELEALALQEGFRLPMAANIIAYFEQQGYVVDLCNGEVHSTVTVALAPSAQALCHLYGVSDDDVAAIFAPVAEPAVDVDLSDYDAEADDYAEDIADRDFWRRGDW